MEAILAENHRKVVENEKKPKLQFWTQATSWENFENFDDVDEILRVFFLWCIYEQSDL